MILGSCFVSTVLHIKQPDISYLDEYQHMEAITATLLYIRPESPTLIFFVYLGFYYSVMYMKCSIPYIHRTGPRVVVKSFYIHILFSEGPSFDSLLGGFST
jgi:hypothetical protein